MNDFIPGQRWISNTESELGLGMILEVEFNRVTVLFLATGDRRVYAKDNAPLTRVKFSEGDLIESVEYDKITITQVDENNGLLTYTGFDEEGGLHQIDEMELNHHIQFNKPQDRLFNGQFDPAHWFQLRYQTWERLQKHHLSPVKGLQAARAALIPHQLYIAQQAASRVSPRVMLADEVGLGKTIEAGLIIQHRLINSLSQRVLILVPDPLLHQWLVEMLRRFSLKFSVFDESRCLACDDENPFLTEQLILCSQGFFNQSQKRQQQAIEAGWDLVVVDEAHHLEWSEAAPSEDYLFVESLSAVSPGLVLLTATPEQLGKESHFARLRLLDPDRFYQFNQFQSDEALFEPVAQLAHTLMGNDPLSASEVELLKALLKNDNAESQIHEVNQGGRENRDDLMRLLLDHHGTGRILFRNSRHTVQGFPDREHYGYPLNDNGTVDLAKSAYFSWLLEKLETLKDEKALLICQKAETVIKLEQLLKKHVGHTAAMFHEGMSIVERDRAAAFFADEESRAQILICSEIGSEGRNFQFVRHLILFDLPENPDLLQQRIGRLDRIGQKHVIQLHIPYVMDSRQHRLFRWYDEGLNAFSHNCSGASQVVKLLGQQFSEYLDSDSHIEQLIKITKELNAQIEQELFNGRDLLLEMNSCRPEKAEEIVKQIRQNDQDDSLWAYMESIFDCYGVDVEFHSRYCHILMPSESLRISHFPYLEDDGVTITLNREKALEREDMLFLTQEHPMVLSAMDLVVSSETGNAAVCAVKHPELKPGQFLLELLFIVECMAPAELQVSRFLPHTPIRILLDQNRKNLSTAIAHESLIEAENSFDKVQIAQFLNHQRSLIQDIIKRAEDVAALEMKELVTQSSNQMIATLTSEIKRMVRLKKVNPSIKELEIEELKNMTLLTHEAIQEAQLRLDAVRFLITT